jgi:hypothetical protein
VRVWKTSRASWFETPGVATLLTMRAEKKTLRGALARVSKDEAAEPESTLEFWTRDGNGYGSS